MSITEGTQPGAVQWTGAWTTAQTTASFTPESGALLVALVAADGNQVAGTVTASVTDSLSGSWTLLKRQNTTGTNTGGTAEVWCRDSPGTALTVSVTGSGNPANGGQLVVRTLIGAKATASQNGATNGATEDPAAAVQVSVAAGAGNKIYGAAFNFSTSTVMSPLANTTAISQFSDTTNGDTWEAFKSSGDTAGTATYGYSTSTTGMIAAVEIIAAPSAAAAGASQARPGQTWLRRFHHRQFTAPSFVAAAAPTSGPPVYPLAGPVQAKVRGLPPSGRTAGSRGTRSQTGPPVTPLSGPVGLGRRQPPVPAGTAAGSGGLFAQTGPPVTPLQRPVQARQPLPRRGRITASAGTRAQTGPPLTPARGPVRARFPLPPRGRTAGNRGTFTAVVPQAGPPVTPLRGPVQAQIRGLPPRGRTTGNPGTRAQQGPPVTPLRGPVRAARPSQLQGGRCRGAQGTFTFVGIQSGPPVYPLHGPVRTRPQPPPRGRCAGNRGVRAQTGPPVTPLRGPVAPFRPGPYRSGRCQSSPGTRAQTGPPVTPLQRPVRSRIPHRVRGGHIAGSAGAPVFIPPFTIGTLTASDRPLDVLTALTAAGGSGGVLTASDTRTGGPS